MKNFWMLEHFDTATEGAAAGLLAFMMGISEECWAAGWEKDLELVLWRVTPGRSYGRGAITERQATLLALLAEEAGGWWLWRYDEPEFIPTEEWLRIYAASDASAT